MSTATTGNPPRAQAAQTGQTGQGALAALTVSQHASAAGDVAASSETLSLDAQQIYRSLADADATTDTAYLNSSQEPAAAQQRYQADIAPSGARWATAAQGEAGAWFAVNKQVHALDAGYHYIAETQLVTGTGPGTVAADFGRLDDDIGNAIAADQAVFNSSSAAGSGAFGGLEAGIIVAALVMAACCAWGLSRRLAEYR